MGEEQGRYDCIRASGVHHAGVVGMLEAEALMGRITVTEML